MRPKAANTKAWEVRFAYFGRSFCFAAFFTLKFFNLRTQSPPHIQLWTRTHIHAHTPTHAHTTHTRRTRTHTGIHETPFCHCGRPVKTPVVEWEEKDWMLQLLTQGPHFGPPGITSVKEETETSNFRKPELKEKNTTVWSKIAVQEWVTSTLELNLTLHSLKELESKN